MAIKGCSAGFYLGTNKVAELNNISNSFTGDTLDVTSFDSSCVRQFIAGLRSGTISISGFYVPGDTNGQAAMFTSFLNGAILTTTQKPRFLYNGTNGFTADGLVSSYTVEATPEGTVNFSAEIQLTGTIAVV
jgi:predicted secreted protein